MARLSRILSRVRVVADQPRISAAPGQLSRDASRAELTEDAARRELSEETGFVPAAGTPMRPLGSFYSLPSETNKYTHLFLASPVIEAGPARLDNEIEKYFDMSVVLLPAGQALEGIGTIITSMETVGALMAARTALQAAASR